MKMIVAVSAGQTLWKKDFSNIRKHVHYLNYGLLGLATIIKTFGHREIKMFQGEGTVADLISDMFSEGIDLNRDCDAILLSIPSNYSLAWSQEFCRVVHEMSNVPIIVGGRWVVDGHVEWVHKKLKYESRIIEGFGEGPLAAALGVDLPQEYCDGSKRCFDWLDYTLLFNYHLFSPSIEVSRGCGSGCQFCADNNNKRLINKPAEQIMCELDMLDKLYKNYNVYLEAPHFVFEPTWMDAFSDGMLSRDRIVPWRCTTRVESVPIQHIAYMASCGLKVLDIGLESASPLQLCRMHKTTNPQWYLQRADQLLAECAKYDIFVKFNILLYAGETEETVEETAQWLRQRQNLIKDVSVSSLVYYHNMDSLKELEALGASMPDSDEFTENGFCNLNLSPEISAMDAIRISHKLSCIVATQRDFYDIKAFSYFEPGYTYDMFLADLHLCDPEALPFRIGDEL